MIQRIQTVFMLLAAAAAFCLFAFPFASTSEAVSGSAMFADGFYNIQDHIALMILFCAAGILSFVSIFMFKNRTTQLLLNRFAFIANTIGLVLAIVLFFNDRDSLGSVDPEDGIGLYLPILFIVFTLLAMRYINKDKELVNSSYNRLR